MRLASYALLGLMAIITLATPGSTRAEPVYLPLSVGDSWSYEAGEGIGEILTVIGTRDLLGATVSVIDYSESTNNDSLENYWTREGDGDVLLWGFMREESGGFGYAYVPPVCWIDAPVFVGKTWRCTSMVYELPSEVPLALPLVVELEVTWEGPVTVPAGTFFSIGISGSTSMPALARMHDLALDGRSLGTRPSTVYWYSDGVGEVQYDLDALYQLSSYGVAPVEAVTWGRIKGLYR